MRMPSAMPVAYGASCDGIALRSPHGGMPYAPIAVAAGQAASSKSILSQPADSVFAARHDASETIRREPPSAKRTSSAATKPAGLAFTSDLAFSTIIASALGPSFKAAVTSNRAGVRQSAEEPTVTPFRRT